MLQCMYFLWMLNLVVGNSNFLSAKGQSSSNCDCIRNQNLSNCVKRRKAFGAKSFTNDDQIVDEKEKFRRAAADRAACIELREEYVNACAMLSRHKIPTTTKEFCEAYETVCFDIPENEPDQPTLPTELPPFQEILHSTPVPSKKHNPKDYTLACRYYKQRYLYVCPDPLRYGQKAVIFCPLYAEKCRVPLPGKPVVPNNEQHSERSMLSTIRNLCAQYKQTAGVFCNNFPITRPEAREACERYKRFCS